MAFLGRLAFNARLYQAESYESIYPSAMTLIDSYLFIT